jgi:hypothetical protein
VCSHHKYEQHKITDLRNIDRKEIKTVEAYELQPINGGLGFSAIGAVAGSLGGAIGKVTDNALLNQPLNKEVLESAGYGAAFGAVSPVSGVVGFLVGVSKSFAGTLLVGPLVSPPPAR